MGNLMGNALLAQPEYIYASKLDELLLLAASASKMPGAYAGEVTPKQAWDFLSQEGGILVDVRTLPEWQSTGIPSLIGTPAKVLTLSWKTYPAMGLNPSFVQQCAAEIPDSHTPVFFLCKTGGRSLDAAIAMTSQGFRCCFNIADGFEGSQNATGQRGCVNGWKAEQLPWVQG